MNCPTTETLERLALGFLEEPAPVRAHVKGCAACAKQMGALGKEHAALAAAAKDVALPRLRMPARPRPRRAAWKLWAAAAALLVGFCGIILLFTDVTETLSVQEGLSQYGGRMKAKRSESPVARPTGERSYWSKLDGETSAEELVLEAREATKSPLRLEPAPPPMEAPALPQPPAPAPEPPAPLAVRPPPPPVKPAPQEDPAVMIFKDHGIHPPVDTAKETTSTFGMDVDTASYAMIRSYLNRGMLPPPEAVRVEECVNAFRYPDPAPKAGTFQITLEAARSPFDAEHHLLRVALRAKDIQERDRKDVVLTFVIDVSGSMAQENRLELVKQALRILVDRLRPTDRVGIVVYGSTARKLLDPTPAARRDQIMGIIDELRTEGSTNLESGLHLGYGLAAKHFDAKATNRVILCSDGVANNGVTDPVQLLAQAKKQREKGVAISALGFGMGNYNDELLEKLANSGDGNYAYIDDLKEAKRIFTEKLVGMMETVAADAKVQVEFDAQTVASWRLVGYENRRLANRDFRNDKVDAGEVGAGHHVTALYEVVLKPDGQGRLATVRIRFREPDTKEVVEDQGSLSRGQVLAAAKEASAAYRLATAAAQFAEILRQSPRAKGITMAQVLDQAESAARDLDRPDDVVEFIGLIKKAQSLRK